jgi:RimJ/RimL family protein N-acetyltransferase
MIETERLVLRAFNNSDIDIITQLYSNEDIMKFMPSPVMNDKMAQSHLDKIIDDWKVMPQTKYEMAVLEKDCHKKIGRAEITRNYADESAMIGWLLIKSEWGKGYATEITNALIKYCFDTLALHRVYALCHPENFASWHVMEKCGMRREAHYIRKCKYVKAEGIRWEDELEYAITRDE